MRSPLLAGALSAAAVLASAAPAAGDSIVYLRDWNVWLANSDGTGQYQVTTDGREALPYLSPSQADDGTIAVAHYDKIKLLRQNGSLIREIDPQPLRNTYSHVQDGSPKYAAISPDGSRIAFSYISFEDSKAQATTGFVAADGTPLPGNLYNGFPSWVTNTRSLTSGGFGSHVNIHDQGQERGEVAERQRRRPQRPRGQPAGDVHRADPPRLQPGHQRQRDLDRLLPDHR